MSRSWNDLAAGPIDAIGLLTAATILFGAALLLGAAWQWFPAWVPRRLPFRGLLAALFQRRTRQGFGKWWRLRRRWWRRRRRDTVETATVETYTDDELPDLPTETFQSNADRLAAEGRYAEAVRERLRAILRALVDTDVIVAFPGWTVTELARAAAANRPALGPALTAAIGIFSDIWYGERPATAAHDDDMRRYAGDIDTILHTAPAGVAR